MIPKRLRLVGVGTSPTGLTVALRGIDARHFVVVLKGMISDELIELSPEDILFISNGMNKLSRLLDEG